MYIIILVKQVYWYISRVSGERLQDHWSSGYLRFLIVICYSDFHNSNIYSLYKYSVFIIVHLKKYKDKQIDFNLVVEVKSHIFSEKWLLKFLL